MTPVVISWLRSRRFGPVLVVCSVLAAIGSVAADTTLRVPVLHRSLPVPVVVVVITTLVITPPLQNRFGELETTLARARLDRGLAGVVACTAALVACVPVGAAAGARFPWNVLLALITLSVMCVIVLGPLAWLATLIAGLAAVYIEFRYAQPIGSALAVVGAPALITAVAVSVSGFAVLGPRTSMPVAKLRRGRRQQRRPTTDTRDETASTVDRVPEEGAHQTRTSVAPG